MNDRMEPHDMLDDVAVYALGALPPAEAKRVRDHLATCEQCREEYAQLKSSATALGYSAESPAADAPNCPSTLLKPRIMRQVRAGASASQSSPPSAKPRDDRGVRPAYLVAAACLAIAIVSSVGDIILTGQLKQAQHDLAQMMQQSTKAKQQLAVSRTALADILDDDSKHYPINGGEIITRGGHLYIAMHDLPQPPRGKVYQAWTLPKGEKKVVPSDTFVPDGRGTAVVPIPVDARLTAAVAISVEPEGGSKQPTTKPIAVVPLT